MRIDPKYFNIFAVSVGISAIIAVIFFNLRYAENQRTRFLDNVGDGSQIYSYWLNSYNETDSVSAQQFVGKFVIIDFWATWSSTSLESHKELWKTIEPYSDSVVIIAAGVKDNEELTKIYAEEREYPFIFVNGSDLFYDLLSPGIPTQLVFGPDGKLLDTRVGFNKRKNYENLTNILSDNGL